MMKNITLSANAEAIEKMRRLMHRENKTFNDAFRKWLDMSVSKGEAAERAKQRQALRESMDKINYVTLDRKYTREEMNER